MRSADLGTSEGARERALAWRLLIAVGIGYLIVQLATVPTSRPPGWDESIYLSQVMPGVDPMFFLASRARGITFLVAPVAWLGGSVRDVRLFLMVASAVAMTVTFRLWIPLVGLAAPLAALLFCGTWQSLVNGSEVMPNLWAAILGLATAGLTARALESGTTSHAVLAAAALGATALVRPTDATVVAAALGLYVLSCRRSHWRLLFVLGAGLIVGWLPWFIEMSVRFGGPVEALREAAAAGRVMTTSVGHNLFVHLAATGGELTPTRVPVPGAISWGLLAILAGVGIVRAVRPTERAVAILASIGALALGAAYVIFVWGTSPRFFLPVYAFASLPAAVGLVALLRATTWSRVAGAGLLALVIPWAIWQGAMPNRFLERRMTSTVALRDIGLRLRELADHRPCSFMSPHGYPMIEFAAGCHGADLLRPRGPTASELAEFGADGREVFVILKREARPASPLGSIVPVPVPGPGRTWLIYHVSGTTD